MKKMILVLLIMFCCIPPVFSKSYISITASPYFDLGSIAWLSGNNVDVYTDKHFEFGAEINLDIGLYKTWNRHSWGLLIGTGIAFPISSQANGIESYPLYSCAITPYAAFGYAFAFTEDLSLEAAFGANTSIGWLNKEGPNGEKIDGKAIDIIEIFLETSVLYNFAPHWALRAGITASIPTFILPVIYQRNITGNDGTRETTTSMLAYIFHIEPFVGIAFTF